MSTINERVKQIRTSLPGKLSMEAFGKRLGVTKTAISLVESGKNALSDQMRLAICREFDVDEVWLRTGQGEMFRQRTRADDIAAYMGKAFGGRVTPIEEALIAVMARTTPEQWEVIYEKILELHEEVAGLKERRSRRKNRKPMQKARS